MRALLIVAMLALVGCAQGLQSPSDMAGGDVARQMRLAAAAERGGQLDVALQIYSALASANPTDAEVAARHANLLVRLGDPDAALDALKAARERHPDDAPLLQAEGRALLELGRAEDALGLFEAHLRTAPTDVASLNGKAVALDLMGRHRDAHMAYRAARQADPRNPLLIGNFALSLVLAGCPDEAAALLEVAPRNMETGAWMGEIRSLARSLAGQGNDVPLALRRALPPSPESCNPA